MQLGQPDGVEAVLLGRLRLGEGLVERVGLAAALRTVKLVEDA